MTDPAIRREFLNLEERWMLLSRSEEFTERFCIDLSGLRTPPASTKSSDGASDTDGATKSAGNKPIAIVDDAQCSRDGLRDLVESFGYKCKTFESAEDYLRSDLNGYTACLILDVHLPGMSGPDLQAHLIADGISPPIVFVTGRFEEPARSRVLAAGAVGYLTKPCDDNALFNCIETALNAGR